MNIARYCHAVPKGPLGDTLPSGQTFSEPHAWLLWREEGSIVQSCHVRHKHVLNVTQDRRGDEACQILQAHRPPCWEGQLVSGALSHPEHVFADRLCHCETLLCQEGDQASLEGGPQPGHPSAQPDEKPSAARGMQRAAEQPPPAQAPLPLPPSLTRWPDPTHTRRVCQQVTPGSARVRHRRARELTSLAGLRGLVAGCGQAAPMGMGTRDVTLGGRVHVV